MINEKHTEILERQIKELEKLQGFLIEYKLFKEATYVADNILNIVNKLNEEETNIPFTISLVVDTLKNDELDKIIKEVNKVAKKQNTNKI